MSLKVRFPKPNFYFILGKHCRGEWDNGKYPVLFFHNYPILLLHHFLFVKILIDFEREEER